MRNAFLDSVPNCMNQHVSFSNGHTGIKHERHGGHSLTHARISYVRICFCVEGACFPSRTYTLKYFASISRPCAQNELCNNTFNNLITMDCRVRSGPFPHRACTQQHAFCRTCISFSFTQPTRWCREVGVFTWGMWDGTHFENVLIETLQILHDVNFFFVGSI